MLEENDSPTEQVPVVPVEVVKDMVPITTVRDIICMIVGSTLCLVQPILQWLGRDISLAVLGAGVTLLLEIPFLHMGDRRSREGRHGRTR